VTSGHCEAPLHRCTKFAISTILIALSVDLKNSEPKRKLSESKRAPSLGGWKNFKEPLGSRQFEVDICFYFSKHVWEPQKYIITRYYFDNHEYQPWYPDWSTTDLVTISKREPPVWVGEKTSKNRRVADSSRWISTLIPGLIHNRPCYNF
jgi:hypothetical protein